MHPDDGTAAARSDDDWHARQNELMDTSHDEVMAYATSEDELSRTLLFSAETLFYSQHLLTVAATYRLSDRFRLLDLGCGDGRLTFEVAARFPNADVIGVDDNERSLELSSRLPKLPNLAFLRGRVENLPEIGVFDMAICSEVYEHVLDPGALLRSIAAVLRPDGLLSLSTPSGWMARTPRLAVLRERIARPKQSALRRNPHHDWAAALELHPGMPWPQLRQSVTDAGFAIESRSSSLAWVDPTSRSLTYAVQRAVGRKNPRRSFLMWLAEASAGRNPHRRAQRLFHTYMALEGLMNLVRPLRPLESRTFILARRAAGSTPGQLQ